MGDYLERETKWEVDAGTELPRFDNVRHGIRVARSTVELTSTYFDTADHDLLSHDVTLRRRDGDTDRGWQLKVPADDGRTEIRADLSDTMPPDIVDLTKGLRLGKELVEVATIQTTRDRHQLRTPTGDLVAEVADDRVRATLPLRPDDVTVWREIEIEAGPAADDLSDIAKSVQEAGAAEPRYPSKMARALQIQSPGEFSTNALEQYLRNQIKIIFAGDVGLRRKRDPIHDTRVAIRRLRSTLRIFAKLFDDEVGKVEQELKWFAGEMGPVRDNNVQRKRFASAIAQLDSALVVGLVAHELDAELRSRQSRARDDLTKTMDSPRYFELLGALQKWASAPPIAGPVTPKKLRKLARRAARKADKRLADGLASDRDDQLHRARKAAKRARYAAELTGGKKKVKHYKKIQRVLGEHQDSVVARQTLLGIAISHAAAVTDTFTLGVLHGREERIAAETRAAASEL